MMFPTISTKAVNVELTKERTNVITQKLAPLARLVSGDDEVRFDVVLRKVGRAWTGEQFCVSVCMSTATQKYYAVANEMYFGRACTKVREDLRRAISKTYRSEEFSLDHMRRYIKEKQYLELFA